MISLLLTYKYIILVPLMIVEGPIVTLIAGFFVTLGIFNPFAVYGLAILGDITGDTIAYLIGRFGGIHLLKTRLGKFLGCTSEKLEEAKNKFQNNHKKTIVFSKIFHGFGITGLTAAGVLKINYLKYIITCISVSMVQSMIFLIVGILFGSAHQTLNKYMNYFAATTITIGICAIIFLIIRSKTKSKTL